MSARFHMPQGKIVQAQCWQVSLARLCWAETATASGRCTVIVERWAVCLGSVTSNSGRVTSNFLPCDR